MLSNNTYNIITIKLSLMHTLLILLIVYSVTLNTRINQ